MNADFSHLPVMLDEVLDVFEPIDDGVVVDATVGGGGHAFAILEAHRAVRLVGLDQDPEALAAAAVTLAPHLARVDLRRARFDAMDAELDELGIDEIAGVLFDLGVSSHQLDVASRGFSFRQSGPLDMRMDPDAARSAASVVNEADEVELTSILREYGDERRARHIARAIVAARPLATTAELAEVVAEAMPAASRRSPGHPARRTFQALRIAVNQELDVLGPAIDHALDRLRPGGRGAILSYHSGEDRIVKRTLRAAAGLDRTQSAALPPPDVDPPAIRLLHRKGKTPSDVELERNPRASAATSVLRTTGRGLMNLTYTTAPRPVPTTPAPSIEEVPRPRRTLRITTVVLSLLATVLLFGLVGFQALIVSSQSTIDDLDAQIGSATRTNQRLRLDVAALESPERIRAIALTTLGMIEPVVVDYLEPIAAAELGLVGGADQ